MEQLRKHGGDIWSISEKYGLKKEEILDFSSNINPLGPSKKVLKSLQENLFLINRYPDSQSNDLKIALANYLNIEKENLVLGNGASELIFLLVSYLKPKKVWVTAPSFSEYELAARANNVLVRRLELEKENFRSFSLEELANFQKGDLLFICNPNNPTGQLYSEEFLLEVIELVHKREGYILIDESFLDFLKERNKKTFIRKGQEYKNLLVLYSLTKFYSLPGIRLGVLFASENIVKEVDQIRDPWNINVFAQIAGEEAIKDEEFIEKSLDFFEKEKEYMYASLRKIKNIRVFEPSANYVFIELLNGIRSSDLEDKMAKRGIMIRNCNTYPGLGENYIRVAIKLREENEKMISNLKTILEGEVN